MIRRIFTCLLLLCSSACLFAQDKETDFTSVVSGIVTDTHGVPLSHVNVMADSTNISVVTNDDGFFTLKTPEQPAFIVISHIGYKSRRIPVISGKTANMRIRLQSNSIVLNDVVVKSGDPKKIFYEALDKIPENYSAKPDLFTTFYRETVQKRQRYIYIAEAVASLYKTSYRMLPRSDKVAIDKGRRLLSPSHRDTLGVKIMGGPTSAIYLDFVKNTDLILNAEDLTHYDFIMEDPVFIAERPHYVIRLDPRYVAPYALYYGTFYIDWETLAFTRAELSLDMRDKEKATNMILVSKPAGVKFRPREMTILVNFKYDGVFSRISYVKNVFRFNCDWKKRLFATSFTAVSELVVTDRKEENIIPIKGRNSFYQRDSFFDKVEFFEDPDFWADYNIIEPTESLEDAIDKLRKKKR